MAACQTKDEGCHFFTFNRTDITPRTFSTVSEKCLNKIELTVQYLLIQCDDFQILTLYKLDENFVMNRVLFLASIVNNDA